MANHSRKIVGADGVRALACLWVFANHTTIALGKPGGGDGFCRMYGTLGVAIFFVLSGMLLSVPFWQRYQDGRPFPELALYTRARLARILPAYYLCLGVMLLLDGDYSGENLGRSLAAVLLVNSLHWRTFFPSERDGALWSIGVELWFYLLLPLWAAGLFRFRRVVPAWLYLLLSGAALVLIQMAIGHAGVSFESSITPDARELQRVAAGWLPLTNPLGLFAHFLFGCGAGGLFVHLSRRLESASASPTSSGWNRYDWASLGLVGMLYLDLYPPTLLKGLWRHAHVWFMSYNWPLFPALIMGLLVALSFSARLGYWVDNGFLRWTAKLSYGIYLWHMPILWAVGRLWPKPIMATNLPGQAAYTFVSGLLAYGVAGVSFRVLETPVMRWVVRKSRT